MALLHDSDYNYQRREYERMVREANQRSAATQNAQVPTRQMAGDSIDNELEKQRQVAAYLQAQSELAAQQQAEAEAAAAGGAGGGGYGGGGFSTAGVDQALAAYQERLNAGKTQALGSLDQILAGALPKYDQYAQAGQQAAGGAGAAIQQALGQRQGESDAALQAVLRDLQAQGFSGDTVRAQGAANSGTMADQAGLQQALSQRLAANLAQSLTDRKSAAQMIDQGARSTVEQNYAAALLAAQQRAAQQAAALARSAYGSGRRGGGSRSSAAPSDTETLVQTDTAQSPYAGLDEILAARGGPYQKTFNDAVYRGLAYGNGDIARALGALTGMQDKGVRDINGNNINDILNVLWDAQRNQRTQKAVTTFKRRSR